MVNAQPFCPLPFVGVLHATLQPANLGLAAARSSEAARANGQSRLAREALQAGAQVQRAVAWTLATPPFVALDTFAGTTAPAHRLAAAQAPAVRLGFEPSAPSDTFGLPGTLGMAATNGCARLLGAVLWPTGLGHAAGSGVQLAGRFVTGVVCGSVAGATLLLKGAVAFTVAAVCAGVQICLAIARLAHAPSGEVALATPLPPVPASWRWQAQDNLGRLDAPIGREAQIRRALGERAAAKLVQDGHWRILPALAPWPLPATTPGRASARAARWSEHVELLKRPATTVRLLEGCSVESDDARLDLAALLACVPAPKAYTRQRARPIAGDLAAARAPGAQPEAVQLETLLSWAPGSRTTAADARCVYLREALALTFTVQVQAPLSPTTRTPVAEVTLARLWVGQQAFDGLTGP